MGINTKLIQASKGTCIKNNFANPIRKTNPTKRISDIIYQEYPKLNRQNLYPT